MPYYPFHTQNPLNFTGNWMAATRTELVPGPEPPQAAVASILLQDVLQGTRWSGISAVFPLNHVSEPSDGKGSCCGKAPTQRVQLCNNTLRSWGKKGKWLGLAALSLTSALNCIPGPWVYLTLFCGNNNEGLALGTRGSLSGGTAVSQGLPGSPRVLPKFPCCLLQCWWGCRLRWA